MSLLFPTLALAGLVAAAAPIVIHLLSRLRRRVVHWGAMDFLLASHRKSRWLVRLNELLLLLMRVAIVLVGGVLIAGPRWSDSLLTRLLRGTKQHILVIDDSYSMGEQLEDGSPWLQARAAAQRIVDEAATTAAPSPILIRYSDVCRDPTGGLGSDAPSEVAFNGVDALAKAAAAVASADTAAVVYWLSDFRRAAGEADVAAAAAKLSDVADDLVLCVCGRPVEQANLAIESLRVEPGSVTAGSELNVRVTLRNLGATGAKGGALLTRTKATTQSVEFDSVTAGATSEVTVGVRLSEGVNELVFVAPDDALSNDNVRRLVVEAPPSRAVTILDGSQRSEEGRAFAAAIAPAGVATGWRARVVETSRLDAEVIDQAADSPVLIVADVREITPPAVDRLRRRLDRGHGVLFVLGPTTDPTPWARVFGAESFADLAIGQVITAPVTARGLSATQHPVLRLSTTVGEPLLPFVRVGVHHELQPRGEGWQVMATLSTDEPLLVTRSIGSGRMAVMASPAAATERGGERWSNLATLPLFPLLAGDVVAWLAQPALQPTDTLVGEALPESLRPAPELAMNQAVWSDACHAFMAAGTYDVAAANAPKRVAVNVDPAEGRLARLSPEELQSTFGAEAMVIPATRLSEGSAEPQDLSIAISALLLLLLSGERLLSSRGV